MTISKNNISLFILNLTLSVIMHLHCQAQSNPPQNVSPDTSQIKINLFNHKKVMNEIFGTPNMDIRTIGIFVYDGFFTLDAIGPMAVFSELMDTKVFYISHKKGLVKSGRTQIYVSHTINEIKELDILVIPGGSTATWHLTKDTALLNWIRKIDKTTQITASVCTGAWILGAAGLLQGKKATTHWYRAQEMLGRFGATYESKRYVNDGKYWTSAGVTAGMDMCLAIIQYIRGDKYTQGAMLDLEYDPQPPIEGGIPAKSDPKVFQFMQTMYDYGMLPLIRNDNEEKKANTSNNKSKKKTKHKSCETKQNHCHE
ncbi:MAG: DJ-1/PfpI family protein [Cytophagaceae bacterium]|nr:DJ-1/PfpI family protein [Cytophagaceae bacterium]MDW8455447.1 DJ-1/PfpI family protein [Cytophagaceae bacterium]